MNGCGVHIEDRFDFAPVVSAFEQSHQLNVDNLVQPASNPQIGAVPPLGTLTRLQQLPRTSNPATDAVHAIG
jgi:hypothetical protein